MKLPPKGDPKRPLFLAAASCRFLGGLCILFGGFATLPLFLDGSPAAGEFIALLLGPILYLSVGLTWWIVGGKLRQLKLWATTVGIVLASLALSNVVLLLFMIVSGGNLQSMSDTFWVMPIVLLLFMAAFIQLILQLVNGRQFIHSLKIRGFETLPVNPVPLPVLPLAETDHPQALPDR